MYFRSLLVDVTMCIGLYMYMLSTSYEKRFTAFAGCTLIDKEAIIRG